MKRTNDALRANVPNSHPGLFGRVAGHYRRGDAHRQRVSGYVAQYHGIGAYLGVVADGNASDNLGSRADQHIIANDGPCRRGKIHVWLASPQGYALHDGAVVADLLGTDYSANGMRQEQSATYPHFWGYLDTEYDNIDYRE